MLGGVPAHHRLALLRVRSPARAYYRAALYGLGVPGGIDAYLHRSPSLLLIASATTPGRHSAAGHSCHSPVKGSRILTSPGPAQRTSLRLLGPRCDSSLGRVSNSSRTGLNSISALLSSS